MDNFGDWLSRELKKRNWKQADLVRESNLDSAVISNLINGKRKAGEVTITAIAHALKLPPEDVFHAAGIFKLTYNPAEDRDPTLLEWIKLYKDADEPKREEMLRYARYVRDQQEQESARSLKELKPRKAK